MVHEWLLAVHDKAYSSNPVGKNVSGWAHILDEGEATSPTVYTNKNGSAELTKVNTISVVPIVNGYAHFYLDESVTTIDVCYFTATGESGMVKSMTRGVPSYLSVDTHYTGFQTLWVPIAFLASSAVTDTTLDLPANLEIYDANILTTTADSGVTIDVGFNNAVESGDLDGLLDGMLVTALGRGIPWQVITGGSNIDYIDDAAGKYGALLATWIDGADAVATLGGMTRLTYITNGTIKSLVYTPANSDTFEGFIQLTYRKCMG